MESIDLTKLSTPQLYAIRKVLTSGAPAVSSKFKTAETKKLKAEIADLRKLNSRWQQIENANLADSFDYETDADYILSFSNEDFNRTIDNLVKAKKATAEKAPTMRIPQMSSSDDGIDLIAALKEELRKRKNGG